MSCPFPRLSFVPSPFFPSFQGNHLRGNLEPPGSVLELLAHPQDPVGKCLGRASRGGPGYWVHQAAAGTSVQPGEVRAAVGLGRGGGI